MGCVLGVPIN